MYHPNMALFCAVYFGGLNQMFFNPRQEITFLDHIVGTVCVFLFPFLIYFCVFSFMVSPLPPPLLPLFFAALTSFHLASMHVSEK
jgi:hypothetical protein